VVQSALQRYSGAMATIQVREIPEEAYEVLRRRARRAGQSMQAYMRDQVIALASRPTKEEALAAIEATLQRAGITKSPDVESIVDDVVADRR
jgi:antitoxin FitA